MSATPNYFVVWWRYRIHLARCRCITKYRSRHGGWTEQKALATRYGSQAEAERVARMLLSADRPEFVVGEQSPDGGRAKVVSVVTLPESEEDR